MCNGSNWGFLVYIMTYTIFIDQRFAVANDLTIVQTTTLAACMTLPTWTNTITVDGVVWYQYSEIKMVEDFPLLFGIPKRVYKNLKELADKGFLELSSFGKTKYLRFTEKCKTWNRNDLENCETENGLQSGPKTDYSETENGLHDYIINNNIINNNKEAPKQSLDATLFPETEEVKEDKAKKTLFANCVWADMNKFIDYFKGQPGMENVDLVYYYHSVSDWSDSKNMKRTARGWLATVRQFMRSDREKGKLKMNQSLSKHQQEMNYEGATEYLKDFDE